MRKNFLIFFLGLVTGLSFMWAGVWWVGKSGKKLEIKVEKERTLDKYSIESLGNREYDSELMFEDITASKEAFFVQKFSFNTDGKKVTGLAHIPTNCEKCPIIAQFRGYADKSVYQPGYGTWRSAEQFAKAGYISLAPDFLGYADSASPSANIWEARFETYTTALNFLAGINKWEKSNGRVGVWGHSNGGYITMTALEASRRSYPTVLWAPVTAPFPYAVLFFTDENPDYGKSLRKSLSRFEEEYDTEKYSVINYLDRITAKILLLQGSEDIQVPIRWSNVTVSKLRDLGKDITYTVFQGADHNLIPNWNEAVEKSIQFYDKNLKQ